jgi:hypothetical protein
VRALAVRFIGSFDSQYFALRVILGVQILSFIFSDSLSTGKDYLLYIQISSLPISYCLWVPDHKFVIYGGFYHKLPFPVPFTTTYYLWNPLSISSRFQSFKREYIISYTLRIFVTTPPPPLCKELKGRIQKKGKNRI